MEFNMSNMLKHWKLFLVLIVIFQSLSGIVFYLLDVPDIKVSDNFYLNSDSLALSVGGGAACIVFFIVLKNKKQ